MKTKVVINLNDYVKVKLTPHGESVYHTYCQQYQIPCSILKDEEGYTRFLLYELMNIFGEEMVIYNPNMVFEDNMIIYEESKGCL